MAFESDIFRLKCIKNLYIIIFILLGLSGVLLMTVGVFYVSSGELSINNFSIFVIVSLSLIILSVFFFSSYDKKKREIRISEIPDNYDEYSEKDKKRKN